MEALAAVVMFVLCLILPFTLAYFVIVGLTVLICIAFGFEFSWMYALGIWAIYLLLMFIFRGLRKCKDEKYHFSKEKSANDQD